MKNYLSLDATKQKKAVFLECIHASEGHQKAVLKDCRLDSKNPEQNNRNSLVLVANILSTMSWYSKVVHYSVTL